MSDEQVQRRKRVSDGGLGRSEDPTMPVRILPEGANTNAAPNSASANSPGEWVLNYGDDPAQDEPTTRLPAEVEGNRALRPGTLYTPATTPNPQVASQPR